MTDTAHLNSLFENATEGIIITNTSGKIIMVNPAAAKMFGYKISELLGELIEILIPDKYKSHHQHLRQGFYSDPSNRSMGHGRDLNGKKKDESNLPLEVSLSHYQKDGELFVMAFIVDITERKRIEQSMLEQKAELEQITEKIRQLNSELELKVDDRTRILKDALEKLEASQIELNQALDKERQLNEIKSRFVSMASHEFRTPLTTVLSSASLLQKYTRTEEQDKRDRHVVKIKNSVNNLNNILEDFLSLGKLNEGRVEAKKELLLLKGQIKNTLEELQPLLKSGQYFILNCEDMEVDTDKQLLHNILINLVSNAIKFSDENKPVIVDVKIGDDLLILSVTDEGIGISKEDQDHLFTSFFRAANAINIQGTGLGLHIVRRYAELLGGEVKLFSELGKGTKVEVLIPVNLKARK